MLSSLDSRTVVFLNGILRAHHFLGGIIGGLGVNPIARGLPVVVPLLVLWFSRENAKTRARILLGLFGATLATLLAAMLQMYLQLEIRPLFNPQLHLYLHGQVDPRVWDHENSFPSVTATLYFSISTIVLLEWRFGGAIAWIWSLITDGFCRVVLGLEYPVDILASIVLGIGFVLGFSKLRVVQFKIKSFLEEVRPRAAWVHAILIVFLADAYSLFPGLQGLIRFLVLVGRRW